MKARGFIFLGALVSASLFGGAAVAESMDCGPLTNSFGPFDYRLPSPKSGTYGGSPKDLVEGAHFTPNIEMLKSSKTGKGHPGGDIAYTLRAFPNHHRALKSMSELALREKTEMPRNMKISVQCWFQRAMKFAPDDGMVRMLYGYYLLKKGQGARAVEEFEGAEGLMTDSANLHYNMGLAYVEVKDFNKALDHAHRAYALGFPLPGLRARLERLGQWRDPDPNVSYPNLGN